MKIIHVSDSHGTFTPLDLDGIDLIVHSGDMLRSFSWGDRAIEVPRQREWLRENAERFVEWFGGVPVLFTCGNHEFTSGTEIESVLRRAGCKFTDLTGRSDTIAGLKWFGLPWVPRYGTWNYGCEADELAARTNIALAEEPDVLVAHCPPWGMLDLNAGGLTFSGRYPKPEHIGNRALSAWLRRDDVKRPSTILCGHCHESHGWLNYGATQISNAATTQHRVEI